MLRGNCEMDTRYGALSIRVAASFKRRCFVIEKDVPSKSPQQLRGFAVRWRHAKPLLALTMGALSCTKATH